MKHFNFIKGLFLALLIVCAAQVKAESYTVTEALSAFVAGETKPAVVTGYIVGSIDGKSISGANFSGTAVSNTNLLIADNADETDITKCLAVQLPAGTIRNALNLVDNPGNYKQLVTLTGSLEKYFGVAGLKTVTEYVIDGVTPEEPETPETPEAGKTLFAETFTTSLGAFTTQETAGNFAWKFEEYNGKGYAKVSGYANGASQEAESWLISPTINFAGVNAAYIAFDYVINKGDASLAATNHKVVVTDNYTGDVATTTWVEVPFGAYNDNTWGFKSTGNIALPEAIMNKEAVVIAFKYMSTTANSSTWEMNNLVIAAGAGETPETPETPVEPETPACEYINETFASDFGVFSTEETVGNYPWVIDYSTAKATSYVDGANNAATSWLISTPVDFTNETEAYVAFEYIIRYAESGKVAENHQLLISADYAGDAAEATWVDLPYNAVEGSNWNTFYKANVAVPAEFLGKNGVVFALRYTATTKAGTWEVKNFKVAHGKVEASEPETPEEAAEYTVAEAIAAFTGTAKPAIVTGYIVGSIDGKSISDANFSGTAVLNTNLLIADNADETDITKCLAVQLPSGTVRNALNLVDNPGNYKQLVTLTGSLEKYFGVAGLKNVKEYSFDGDVPEQPEQPEEPETPEITIGENILLNSGFEEWNDGALTAWGKDGSNASAHSATIAQSTDSNTGSYAVEVNGYADGNKRLASKAYILPAGTYTLSAFIKQSGETAGKFRLGYAVIENGVIDSKNGYFYLTEATEVTSDWECYSAEFTLEEETTVSILVMNNKAGNGASFLVDDVKLVALSTTAIEIVTEDCNAAPLYYDLSGRVVKNPANGIYICNGKKVIVK